MRKKILFGLVIGCLILSGCNSSGGSLITSSETNSTTSNNTTSTGSEHVHTYSNKWSYDKTYHWHQATCEHSEEVIDKSEHNFDSWVIDKEATEEEEGSRHKNCLTCYYRVDEIIPKSEHVHDWDEPTFTWLLDNTTCNAKRECKINRYHVEEETVNSTYAVIYEPTTTSYGLGRYTATFKNAAFGTQTKDVVIPKTEIPVTGISFTDSYKNISMSLGDTKTIFATIIPYNATNQNVTWSSSDETIVTVTSLNTYYAQLTALKKGECTITATSDDGGYRASCAVTVTYIPVTGVSLLTTDLTLEIGGSDNIYASVVPSNATISNVTWSIDDETVASIGLTFTGNCKITALKVGEAIITATTEDGGFTATCHLTVIEKANFAYEIGDVVVTTFTYSSSTYIKAYAPVTNTGNINIYIGTASIDIEDSKGNLKDTLSYMDCYPDIIKPGETTYVYKEAKYKGDVTTGLVGVHHFDIKNAATANGIRYDVSDISFQSNSIYGFKASGKITNNNTSTSNIAYIAIHIFDQSGNFYTVLRGSNYDGIKPGQTATFTASSSAMLYHTNDFTISDIGSYQAYAYEMEYVI